MKFGVKVMLGIPTTDQARRSLEWMDAVMGLQLNLGSSMAKCYVQNKPIAEARNEMCQAALNAGVDYLFMLGDDVIPPANVILTMLKKIGKKFPSYQHPDKLISADFITGIYWARSYPTEPYIYRGVLKGPYEDWKVGEFFQVDIAGCDCLLIDIDALRKVPAPWFSTEWSWEENQEIPPVTTEDFYFFSKMRQHGLNLFADTSIQCLHEERTMGITFGLTNDMPQAGGVYELTNPGETLLVADIAGGKWSPHWQNVKYVKFDGREDSNADVRCDVRNIPVEFKEKFDIVHASHVLEHFPKNEIINVVKHWCTLGKEGAELWIRVPNILNAMRHIVESLESVGQPDHVILNPYFLHQIWGSQEDYDSAFHRWGFGKAQLEKLLTLIPGLENISCEETEEGLNLLGKAIIHHIPHENLAYMWDKIEAQEDIFISHKFAVLPQSVSGPGLQEISRPL